MALATSTRAALPGHSSTPATQQTRVLYVSGLSRSGSTVAQLLCEQVPGVIAVGELTHLWQRGLVEGQLCGCGVPVPACPYWVEVLARAGLSPRDAPEMRRLQRAVDRERHLAWIDRPWAPTRHAALLEEYRQVMGAVLRAARTVSGAAVVVDTSKQPSSAAVLAGCPDVDLRLLHLVRDPRAVAYSCTKVVVRPEVVTAPTTMRRWPPSSTARRWVRENLLTEYVGGSASARLVRTYESLCAEPALFAHDVCALVELHPPGGVSASLGRRELTVGNSHTVGGNPVRFRSGRTTIREDDAWRHELTPRARRTVTTLTAPLMPRYGYPVSGNRRRAGGHAIDEPGPTRLPPVAVIIPTRGRATLARRAVASVLAQEYPGSIECVVVFDQSTPDPTLEVAMVDRTVRVVENTRTAGLAGARNTGIEQTSAPILAFCDDDDWWAPTKLARQVRRLASSPAGTVVSCGLTIHAGRRRISRCWPGPRVELDDLLRSRVQEVHPSSLVFHRATLEQVGLVDEAIPGGYGEDRDWLIRCARQTPLEVVEDPLLHVSWSGTSLFADRYETIIRAIDYGIAKHPDLGAHPQGRVRLEARRAFALAATGRRRAAARGALGVLRRRPLEPRALAALAVAAGAITSSRAQRLANALGRGI